MTALQIFVTHGFQFDVFDSYGPVEDLAKPRIFPTCILERYICGFSIHLLYMADSAKFEVHTNAFLMFKYANQFADAANS